MTTYFAWSNFPIPTARDGGVYNKTITVGNEITAADLGIEDDDFQQLIDAGSVREQPYPKKIADGNYSDSPNRYFRDQLVRAAEGDLDMSELKELQAAGMTGDEETAASNSEEAEGVKEIGLGGIKT